MSIQTRPTLTCVTCRAEIVGRSVFHVGLPFCCAGCVADGPCMCSYDEEDDDGWDLSIPWLDQPSPVAHEPAGLVGASR